MSYCIITDSCCDFSENTYKELNVRMIPLSLSYQEKESTDLSEAFLKSLYQGLRAGKSATTSAINPAQWSGVIESVLAGGEDALVLAFSSGLSTTYQSAVIAAQELKEKYPARTVIVIDTLCASMGQGLLVWYACQKRDEGMALEELAQWCEENKAHLCHWFTVDDLMYLKRGGRISATTALLGTMLQIKPVLHVDNQGHLISVSKARGRKTAIEALAKRFAETALPEQNDTVFISHGDCLEDAQYLAKLLKEKHGVKDVIISYVGAVIGSHAGPGTLALFFLGTTR